MKGKYFRIFVFIIEYNIHERNKTKFTTSMQNITEKIVKLEK